MLTKNCLLNALNETENVYIQNNNEDYDLKEVLQFCTGENFSHHKIRCSDGKERVFKFE